MAGEDHFVSFKLILHTAKNQMLSIFYLITIYLLFFTTIQRIPDPVSRMARLHEGLKDLTVRFSHLDPPLQITNGTRRERRERKGKAGFRYALTSWKKFMKAGMINVCDQVHFSFNENDQVLTVERVVPYVKRTN